MKFVLKWIINGIIVVSLLMYYTDISFWSAVVTATALTVIAYFVGDLLILRASNNMVATISDAVLAFVVLWIAAYEMNWELNLGELLVIAVVLGIAEWLIHRYIFGQQRTARA